MSTVAIINVLQVLGAGFLAPHVVAMIDRFLERATPSWVAYLVAAIVGILFILVPPVQTAAVGFIFGIVVFAILTHQNPGLIPDIWPQDVRPAW